METYHNLNKSHRSKQALSYSSNFKDQLQQPDTIFLLLLNFFLVFSPISLYHGGRKKDK